MACIAVWMAVGRPIWMFHWSDFREGEVVILKAEEFRAKNGRLPTDLAELGNDESVARVFYRKLGADEFEVWFGLELGESEIYNSQTKRWE